jgi:hypothetical protein
MISDRDRALRQLWLKWGMPEHMKIVNSKTGEVTHLIDGLPTDNPPQERPRKSRAKSCNPKWDEIYRIAMGR